VVSRGHNPNSLFVEFFGEKGWTKRFILGPEFEGNIQVLTVDKDNSIYFLSQEKGFGPVNKRGGWILHRCALKDKDISCEIVLERPHSIYSYDILPDGDIIFTESDDNCIRRISPKHTNAECVAGGRRPGWIYLIGISPDGRRLAYKKFNDLYVVEIIR